MHLGRISLNSSILAITLSLTLSLVRCPLNAACESDTR